jgi:hypothetical protein
LYSTNPPPRSPIATMAPITPPAIAAAFVVAAWLMVGWSVNGELVDWFLLLSGELVVMAGGAADVDCELGGCGLPELGGAGLAPGEAVDGIEGIGVGTAVKGENVGTGVGGGAAPATQRSTTTTVDNPSTKKPVEVCKIRGVVSVMR